MYRGTTPTLIFRLNSPNLNLAAVSELWVTLKQAPYSKTWDRTQCSLDNEQKTVTVTLTQEETLEMPETSNMKVQIRFLMNDGKALATNIATVDVNQILKDGVIE
ncbi:MAG: hypothetical protein J6Y02_02735 [Pseudobutyrivibrio sp.]|nr:hypothetical protein [Pseudobutyrivibrio sp.]